MVCFNFTLCLTPNLLLANNDAVFRSAFNDDGWIMLCHTCANPKRIPREEFWKKRDEVRIATVQDLIVYVHDRTMLISEQSNRPFNQKGVFPYVNHPAVSE